MVSLITLDKLENSPKNYKMFWDIFLGFRDFIIHHLNLVQLAQKNINIILKSQGQVHFFLNSLSQSYGLQSVRKPFLWNFYSCRDIKCDDILSGKLKTSLQKALTLCLLWLLYIRRRFPLFLTLTHTRRKWWLNVSFHTFITPHKCTRWSSGLIKHTPARRGSWCRHCDDRKKESVLWRIRKVLQCLVTDVNKHKSKHQIK